MTATLGDVGIVFMLFVVVLYLRRLGNELFELRMEVNEVKLVILDLTGDVIKGTRILNETLNETPKK